MLFDYKWEQMKVSTTEVETPVGEMTIGRFEVGWNTGCLYVKLIMKKKKLINLSYLQLQGLYTRRHNAGWLVGLYQHKCNDRVTMTAHE
jgi:hypothetical protein